MGVILRLVAWLIFWLAVAMLGAELLDFLETGRHSPVTLGDLWRAMDAASHDRSLAEISARIPAARRLVRTMLACPAWLLLGASALILMLQGRRGRRRRTC